MWSYRSPTPHHALCWEQMLLSARGSRAHRPRRMRAPATRRVDGDHLGALFRAPASHGSRFAHDDMSSAQDHGVIALTRRADIDAGDGGFDDSCGRG